MSLTTIEDLKSVTPLLQYTEDDIKEVLKDYDKTVKHLFDDVKIIKNWLKLQPHLPAHPSDRQIATFIVNNKFSIEKTKTKIDMSYTIRDLIPELYTYAYPKSQQFKDMSKYVIVAIVPKLSKSLHRILITSYTKEDHSKIDMDVLSSFGLMFPEILTLVDFSKGFEYIIDISTMTFTLLSQFTPARVLKFLKVLESVYSGRLRSVHLINLTSGLTKIVNFIIGVVTSKSKTKFYIHENIESLQKHYGLEILPSDFGGNEKSIKDLAVDGEKLLESYNDHFLKLTTLRVKEELRPEKLKNDELLGYYGNFKKIDID